MAIVQFKKKLTTDWLLTVHC